MEQRRQAMLQLHLSDEQFFIAYLGVTYIRGLTYVSNGTECDLLNIDPPASYLVVVIIYSKTVIGVVSCWLSW